MTRRSRQPGPDPEHSLSQQQRRDRVQAAVQALPLGLRQVVVLTLEGLSNAEVADIMGISENNVAVRMTRARAELTRLLGGRRRTRRDHGKRTGTQGVGLGLAVWERNGSRLPRAIRLYAHGRNRFSGSGCWPRLSVGAMALPVLAYMGGWRLTPSNAGRWRLLASSRLPRLCVGWWNWRGALMGVDSEHDGGIRCRCRSSACDGCARPGASAGLCWSRKSPYSSSGSGTTLWPMRVPHTPLEERFAWGWLAGHDPVGGHIPAVDWTGESGATPRSLRR